MRISKDESIDAKQRLIFLSNSACSILTNVLYIQKDGVNDSSGGQACLVFRHQSSLRPEDPQEFKLGNFAIKGYLLHSSVRYDSLRIQLTAFKLKEPKLNCARKVASRVEYLELLVQHPGAAHDLLDDFHNGAQSPGYIVVGVNECYTSVNVRHAESLLAKSTSVGCIVRHVKPGTSIFEKLGRGLRSRWISMLSSMFSFVVDTVAGTISINLNRPAIRTIACKIAGSHSQQNTCA
ncbi:MAG: hypothetical protein JOS17DRAFT_835437 [Linnemannia elongata]|nr:MAG: hypothetical protein JOS17DRAFT_835437 [Linnemannia elongata]